MELHLNCRAAEDELCAVSEERDKLLPQLEEAKWRSRQTEKELAQLTESSGLLQQVSTIHTMVGTC